MKFCTKHRDHFKWRFHFELSLTDPVWGLRSFRPYFSIALVKFHTLPKIGDMAFSKEHYHGFMYRFSLMEHLGVTVKTIIIPSSVRYFAKKYFRIHLHQVYIYPHKITFKKYGI